MMKLSDREWKVFDFLEVFNIVDGYYNKKPAIDLEINSNNIPFLAATKNDNGVTGFINKSIVKKYDKVGNISSKDIKKRIYNGKSLAITNNGSVGNVYYQDTEFTCSHDITVLYLKNRELTKFIALFLIPLLKKTGSKYAYANKWRPKRMKKSKVLLPVDDQCDPDYDFMEQYIIGKYFDLKSQIKKKQKHEICDWRELNDIEWNSYYLYELFEFKRGNQNKMSDLKHGYLPLISAKKTNNGYKGFVEKNNKTLYPGSIISLNNDGDGGAGIAYYQPFQSMMDTHVTALINKKSIDKYTKLFISRMITKQRNKFSHGYAISTNRLNRQIIKLPSKNNHPDYYFMEQYMKRKENEVIDRL
jgi:hypothetical protein